ncbi:hypothetical protein PCE1_001695 [Barthelona sp. PCE]
MHLTNPEHIAVYEQLIAGGKTQVVKDMWDFFVHLCEIPRKSGHEQAAVAELKRIAEEELNCVTEQDEVGNLLISTTEDYEGPGIVIQGHIDMVCDASVGHKGPSGEDWDALKDPIVPYIDDLFLKARGTTLGGDNGIAIAMGLALLKNRETFKHGPLELLVTIEEETTMKGALNCQLPVASKYLINVDSEEEGIITYACAGGSEYSIAIDLARQASELPVVGVSIEGGTAGHSGIDIGKYRLNCGKALGRMLFGEDILLKDIKFGAARNIICPNAAASLHVADVEAFKVKIENKFNVIKEEYKNTDPGLVLKWNEPSTEVAMTPESSKKVIDLLVAAPHGVIRFSPFNAADVQTSVNCAIMMCTEDKATVQFLARSPAMSEMYAFGDKIEAMARLMGGECEREVNIFPGWEPEPESAVMKAFLAAHLEHVGKEMVVEAIHAGLEVGILQDAVLKTTGNKISGVSIGPDLFDVHTVNERLNIGSSERVLDFAIFAIEKLCS